MSIVEANYFFKPNLVRRFASSLALTNPLLTAMPVYGMTRQCMVYTYEEFLRRTKANAARRVLRSVMKMFELDYVPMVVHFCYTELTVEFVEMAHLVMTLCLIADTLTKAIVPEGKRLVEECDYDKFRRISEWFNLFSELTICKEHGRFALPIAFYRTCERINDQLIAYEDRLPPYDHHVTRIEYWSTQTYLVFNDLQNTTILEAQESSELAVMYKQYNKSYLNDVSGFLIKNVAQ
jgi:hypothetical protein